MSLLKKHTFFVFPLFTWSPPKSVIFMITLLGTSVLLLSCTTPTQATVTPPPPPTPTPASTSPSYYVAPTGNDANPGTAEQPFLTFAHALTALQPGDTLIVKDGSYQEPLHISTNGTREAPIIVRAENQYGAILNAVGDEDSTVVITGAYVTFDGFEVAGSDHYCIEVTGTTQTIISNNLVHHCTDHGIYTDATFTTITGNDVSLASLVNEERDMASRWGSGIKVRIGGDHITITNNVVHNNYGEGIAVTRGTNATVAHNTVYDNYSVNIYVDNSYDVLVDSNFVYCTPDSGFERDDHAASAFGMEEEFYSGWGAQLYAVTFSNNIATACYRGLYYWRSDVPDIGLKNISFVHNTIANMERGSLFIEHTPNNAGNIIANNLFFQEDGAYGYVEELDGTILHNNLWSAGEPLAESNLSGEDDVTGDPRLVMPDGLTPDSFQISSRSPAARAAANLGITVDFFGGIRSIPYDIGAHEVTGF